jgi:hypothetical protein
MTSLKSRVERAEREHRFRAWLEVQRFFDNFTEEQLRTYARHGCLSKPLPEPLPRGKSRLDGLDRKSLIRLWREHDRIFRGRSKEEMLFFAIHAHWPEQACDERCDEKNCQKPEVDERARNLEATEAKNDYYRQ